MQFSGLMSRWQKPLSWMHAMPLSSCLKNPRASVSTTLYGRTMMFEGKT